MYHISESHGLYSISCRRVLNRYIIVPLPQVLPFLCDCCGKSFAQAGNLKKHLFTHLPQTPYHCQHCNKYFTSASDLRRHMYTHTHKKAFKCTKCNYSFSQPAALKRHMSKQHNETQMLHMCSVCMLFFPLRDGLIQHNELVHCAKPLHCVHCDLEFADRGKLDDHLDEVHVGIH